MHISLFLTRIYTLLYEVYVLYNCRHYVDFSQRSASTLEPKTGKCEEIFIPCGVRTYGFSGTKIPSNFRKNALARAHYRGPWWPSKF